MLSRDLSGKTIEEASDILHDVVERTSSFSEKDDSLRLRALRSNNPYDSDRHSETSSLHRDRRSSSGRSHDYVPCDPSPHSYKPGLSSLNRDERFSDSKSYSYLSRDRSRESSPPNRDKNFSGSKSHDIYKYNRDSSYDLKLKPKKCHLLKKTIEFFGRVVARNGVSIKPAHVKIASEWPIPSKRKILESFLGFVNYHREHIPQFAHLSEPLYKFASKSKSGKITTRWIAGIFRCY